MKARLSLLASSIVFLALAVSACGAPSTVAPPSEEYFGAAATEAPAVFDKSAAEADAQAAGMPLPTMAAIEAGAAPGNAPSSAGHMIIKNADIRLQVKDTDVAIDRTTQIVGDLGGYMVSSRTWYQGYYQYNLKYATITIGVPVDQFERLLSRLRGLAITVLDESASGEDVTDQYVDLQSQLTNLESTRERIKSFLEDAKNVDEALRINQQLSDIERQIEQIKGQMNYLSDRSAYSTVTVNLEPELPVIVDPTPTPVPWEPGKTFDNAGKTLTSAYQGILDFLIWLFVVVVPILLPPVLIVWGLVRLLRRKPKA